MPRFAANLTMLFTELPFLERFAAAADAGFEAVEFQFPYAFGRRQLGERLRRAGLEQVLFNLPPGDWEAGERGLAALSGREAEFRESVERALPYALELSCPTVHVMAGIVAEGMRNARVVDTYVTNLRYAAERFAEHGITVVVEPLNARDVPGYLLSRQGDARAVIERVGRDNVGLQLDLYHCQIMEGDLATHVREFADITHHMQIAGVPGRHEPDVGEINYEFLFRLIDDLGYRGWIGCEYVPAGGTHEGLGWMRPYLD